MKDKLKEVFDKEIELAQDKVRKMLLTTPLKNRTEEAMIVLNRGADSVYDMANWTDEERGSAVQLMMAGYFQVLSLKECERLLRRMERLTEEKVT